MKSDIGSLNSKVTVPRIEARGKFLFQGDQKFYVKGATYGAFRPDESGNEFHDLAKIEHDFRQMRENGFNTVRIPHTVPPVSLLDAALRQGLRVMVGLSAEQYVGYLIDRKDAPDIPATIRSKVRDCAGHPALLCYAIGNEIPASILRWIGRRKIERYLRTIFDVVKEEDPEGLVTYVNYPSTEYLELPFLDLVSFNVYLESPDRYAAYLARLQNIAGERPLIMSELGLDSVRNGTEAQAEALTWQIDLSFRGGCAGAFVFSWTDEWYRGGADVEDWGFGLTDQERRPKPALAAARKAFAMAPMAPRTDWPLVSIIVCCHNGERFLPECFDGIKALEYPNYEVVVVNDGSTDATAEIIERYGFFCIHTENRGLSSARNVGLGAATGEIVAYLDADALPDPHWLHYLVDTFETTTFAAVGGPNIAPPGDGMIAACVTNAPGGPIHVLLSDVEAEHIPGCNLAIRKSYLDKIGGFDPQFRAAGDDVDVCWRLQEEGWSLGFNPAAVVWHHRRNSVRDYWKQQRGYGKAEALLEAKWPEKYNRFGHFTWSGRIYGNGAAFELGRVRRIYYGTWGLAPFQRMYDGPSRLLQSIPMTPEWWFVIAALFTAAAVGIAWTPMLLLTPLLGAALGVIFLQAGLGAARAVYPERPKNLGKRVAMRGLTAFLHILQPMARLRGRLGYGLHPWRRLKKGRGALPRRRKRAFWSDTWVEPYERLDRVRQLLKGHGAIVFHGGAYDAWDLEVRGGPLASVRMTMGIEDQGAGSQYVRTRTWPTISRVALLGGALLTGLAALSTTAPGWIAPAVLGLGAAFVWVVAFVEASTASGLLVEVLKSMEREG